MRIFVQVVLGLVPACLVTLSGLLFLGLISTTFQQILIVSAVLGTSGLIWSLVGYSRKTAVLVLVLLLVGIGGVLLGGLTGAISGLMIASGNGQLGSPASLLLRLLVACWIIFGPTAVGLYQARRAIQVLRVVA